MYLQMWLKYHTHTHKHSHTHTFSLIHQCITMISTAFVSPSLTTTTTFTFTPSRHYQHALHSHPAFSTTTRRRVRHAAATPRARRTATIKSVWVERSAAVDIEAEPAEVFVYYSDLTNLPLWSPWVKQVDIDRNDPLLSRWKLGARGFTFDWSAKMRVVERSKRIAWTSDQGLKNEGDVTFRRAEEGGDTTTVKLAIKVDVPWLVASLFDLQFVKTFVDSTLEADLKRLRTVVLQKKRAREGDGKRVPSKAADAVEKAMSILNK